MKRLENDGIVLIEVVPENIEQYLYVKKEASMFSKAYEEFEGLWEVMEEDLRQTTFKEGLHMLIYDKHTELLYGYIEAEKDNDNSVGINIGVIKKYRNNGIATKASKTFVDYVFTILDVDFVTWNAFLSNQASCRVAEKIGGIKNCAENVFLETMKTAGFSIDKLEKDELLQEASYKIFRLK